MLLQVGLKLLQPLRLEQHGRQPAIATGENGLHTLRGGRLEAHVDPQRSQGPLHELDASAAGLDRRHRFPLEGGLGLGNVRRQVDRHPRATLVLARPRQDLRRECCQLAHVVVGLTRQADNEVQLDLGNAAAPGQLGGLDDLLVRQPLVDDVAHALTARLGREGDRPRTAAHERLHEKRSNPIDAQRRQRDLSSDVHHPGE